MTSFVTNKQLTHSYFFKEFLIECLSKEAYSYTVLSKRKTVQKRDVEQAIESVDALAFLEGVLDS